MLFVALPARERSSIMPNGGELQSLFVLIAPMALMNWGLPISISLAVVLIVLALLILNRLLSLAMVALRVELTLSFLATMGRGARIGHASIVIAPLATTLCTLTFEK